MIRMPARRPASQEGSAPGGQDALSLLKGGSARLHFNTAGRADAWGCGTSVATGYTAAESRIYFILNGTKFMERQLVRGG
jgi:hypothetical protein